MRRKELVGFLCYDFLALVRTAVRANTVGEDHLAALGALDHVRGVKLPGAGASRISACLGCFLLRYCHLGYTS